MKSCGKSYQNSPRKCPVSKLFHWNTAFIVSLGEHGKVNTLLCIFLPRPQTTSLAKINNKAMFILKQ